MDKTNINALAQSIERSLHLIYKNMFKIHVRIDLYYGQTKI